MTSVATLLIVNAIALLAAILLLWSWSVRIRDVSFIDAFWAFGMVLLAWASWAQSGAPGARSHLLLGLTTLWGLRLAWHLWSRWRAHGEDPRYAKIMGATMEKKGWSWAKTSLLSVFLTQAPLLFITCLPAQLGIWASDGGRTVLGPLAAVGAVIALIGIAFETIGDAQLNAFRANPANKAKVLDTGLWRYTRHPNYFGDACTWWGIWLVAAETGQPGWISVIGPLFLTFTLTRWSGKPLLEKGIKKTRPEYAEYVRRTSGFFPLPPKKA
jgi:steroid 5-alpha reductase family enzyme